MSRQSHYIADEAAELLLRTMLLTPRGWLHHRGLFGKLEGALEDSECVVYRTAGRTSEASSDGSRGSLGADARRTAGLL